MLFPESLEARMLLSFVYFEQGRGEDAAAASKEFLAAFETVKKKNPKTNWKDLPRQHPNLGLPSYILGFYEKKRGNFSAAYENVQAAIQWSYDMLSCRLQLIDIP
jgi:tetratricopeptide (TPR) repeat protein